MNDSGLRVVSVHGADKHTNIAKKLFLPATSGFVEAGTVKKGSEGFYGVVQGAANTDTPKVHITDRVPEDFVSFTALKAVWTSPAVSGNMVWFFKVAYAALGEYCLWGSDNPSPKTTPTGGWNIINAQESGIELVDIAAGDYFGITFERQGSDALDTLDDTVDLWGFLFEYIANQ